MKILFTILFLLPIICYAQGITFGLDGRYLRKTATPIVYGGTGLSSMGTANQQLRVNSGATALEYFTPFWSRTGTTVSPTTVTDNVTVGTATALAPFTVQTTAAKATVISDNSSNDNAMAFESLVGRRVIQSYSNAAATTAGGVLSLNPAGGSVGINGGVPSGTRVFSVCLGNLFGVNNAGKIDSYGGTNATDGKLIIGNTSTGVWEAGNITAGTGISVTNGAGSITIASSNIKSGSGSPESVVTANPGTLYLNSAGGAGTTLYVKESGTGNTGWVGK